MGRKKKIDNKKILELYLKKKYTVASIARKNSCSRGSVYLILHQNGIEFERRCSCD
jgi:transposase-like protein